MERPLGITVLAIVALIQGILGLLGAFGVAAVGGVLAVFGGPFGALAGMIPAYYAAKIQPVEALRTE